MKILAAIAWRNIWRNPARSGVLIAAIVAGLWAGISVSSLSNGLIVQRFNNLIEQDLTHLQIHHPEYLSEREPWMVVRNTDSIFRLLDNDERVRSFSGRVLSDGIIQSPVTSTGVQIIGIDILNEPRTTNFHLNLKDGEYLDSDLPNPILIGERLAQKLQMEIGNRVVLMFQDIDNDLASAAFHISGLFSTSSRVYDERNVFVRAEHLNELISGDAIIHEIAVILYDAAEADSLTAELNRTFDGIMAETWYELSPELRYMSDFGDSVTFYVMVVIMIALAFGILNTMLMAIFERMRELGMMIAIGMSKARVFMLIMLESVILTLTAAAGGMILAWLSVRYMESNGVDLTVFGGDSLLEFGFDPLIYPFILMSDYFAVTLLVIFTAILAAIYPSIKALRLNPGDVIRE
ncbi:MAG: ABC transporter permease [Balneolaceae bacterium]|nr:MAG: ABC transporter permease [Balneolaceae bacterium]